LEHGIVFEKTNVYIYESHIPPLLRFIHINNISPSGWISFHAVAKIAGKRTTCDYEFQLFERNIVSLANEDTIVPYKICSFDIEASSSHGDFPIPKKTYKKLASEMIEFLRDKKYNKNEFIDYIKQCILTAFGIKTNSCACVNLSLFISSVFPEYLPKDEYVIALIDKLLTTKIKDLKNSNFNELFSIENAFAAQRKKNIEDEDEDNNNNNKNGNNTNGNDEDNGNNDDDDCCYKKKCENDVVPAIVTATEAEAADCDLISILMDTGVLKETKIYELNKALTSLFPKLEGDKVTFIGSTFLKYGDPAPYYNHCVVLNTCDELPNANSDIETYMTEKEVLLAWTNLIQREKPDIIIGYNIFGFDYEFMFHRTEENDCVEDFLKLSKNIDEICGKRILDTNNKYVYKLEESTIRIASGEHHVRYVKINGCVQIDLYNYFRRGENLTSYKLDYVAGYFIGDYVKSFDYTVAVAGEEKDKKNEEKNEEKNQEIRTVVKTKNLSGLTLDSFIHFEEIDYSTDYYNDGEKFKVVSIDKTNGIFEVKGKICPNTKKKIRWCLAKDDVTPKDIFRLSNGSSKDRAIVAKYCIQDCNLVHYLMNKVDIITSCVEMSKICSVPMSFLILRGQGIKLTSYVAKICREKGVLMPVVEKVENDDGYEGAVVLEPKCNLYLDNPVACVDFASLYPSVMISENLSQNSKVWTKEYNLADVLIKVTGSDEYDNLPDYEYVNVTYDTYKYVRKTPKSTATKVKCGYKVCRFAQHISGEKAILPSILHELLLARKTTRKLIPQQTDEFMKNVLDKRQLSYKITANSLYGQCGSRTSTFYDKDIAASTTATGRILLNYAKKIIETVYKDKVCITKLGAVRTNAEYIYGDTDSVFFTFNLKTVGDNPVPIKGRDALAITIELAQEAGHLASSFLKKPHDLEYEKTFMPFCLLSKKRYFGMLYEDDPDKYKCRKEMGIVLKRCDNAPLVKDVYGGTVDMLIKEKRLDNAIHYLKQCLGDLVNEKYPMEKLIISKSLRSGYKNPLTIAHKVLADRITLRDPGNKPNPGDRIPYIYINNSKAVLQGDKIETPSFIIENNVKIDYSFYITNQIMKPVSQLFAIVLIQIWELNGQHKKIQKFKRDEEILRNKYKNDKVKFQEKMDDMKNKEIKSLLFDEFLIETNNKKQGNKSITSFFA
jgi:DNA polymerase elongation subunit (family B)